jgi:UDP-N-acetylglucosamine acyltransferase
MIHDSVIIRGNVTIGERVTIEPYAIITGPCTIGNDVFIGAYAIIGGDAQFRGIYPSPTTAPVCRLGVIVEDGACIREASIIHHGVTGGTRIGADVLLMTGVHIGHDCHVGEGATIGSHTALAGYTIIGDRVTFGQGVITHPWIVIGEAAMVGLNSSVIRDVQPFAKVAGSPARLLGSNTHRDSSLPAAYDFDALGSDVIAGWNDLLGQRSGLKVLASQT